MVSVGAMPIRAVRAYSAAGVDPHDTVPFSKKNEDTLLKVSNESKEKQGKSPRSARRKSQTEKHENVKKVPEAFGLFSPRKEKAHDDTDVHKYFHDGRRKVLGHGTLEAFFDYVLAGSAG